MLNERDPPDKKPLGVETADGDPILDDKGRQKTISASEWIDKNSPVEQMTWAPGEPMVIKDRLIANGSPTATETRLERA